ncbi:MAG: hypothetical protein K6E85_00590 [Lachnospiraceae bacterium]|nr:hypothetical protein [Lachnospiraceae bacterium]
MMRNKRMRIILMSAAFLMIAALLGNTVKSAAATQKLTISDDEYNLYADDVPAEIGDDPHSKFMSNVSNTDDYSLVFDEDAAIENFTAALSKNNITFNEDFICCFKTVLYDWSGDDEKVVTSLKVETYFPLPTEAQEFPDECRFYKLSSGTLTPVVPLDLYDIDDALYVKISYNSATDFNAIYGFVYADPDSFEEEDPDDEEDEDPDDEEDEDEDEPTATPTPKPTAAPTAAPTSKPDETITSAPTATPVPTTKPNTSGGSNTSSGGSGKKDSIPKTGDDFPLGGIVATSVVAAGVLAGAVIFMKKRK